MAACICLLITAVVFSRSLHDGFNESMEDIVSNDGNNHTIESASYPMITIPDYSGWKEDSTQIKYYDLARGDDSTTDKENTESYSNFQDYLSLPVFRNLTLNSSIILVESMEELENQLNSLTEYEKVGPYPILNISDAILYLRNGKYITFVDSEMELTEEITSELVYLYDKEADIAIPFYHFTADNNRVNKSDISGWFVPAISDEYITNMPEIGVKE